MEWTCAQCTYANRNPSARVCDVCGFRRNDQAQGSAEEAPLLQYRVNMYDGRGPRGGNGEGDLDIGTVGKICIGIVILLLVCVVLLLWSMTTVEPTQQALAQNLVTGIVYKDQTYAAGRYFLGPWLSMIHFPANQVLVEYSTAPHANAPPIRARTGRDEDDPDSGGQPVTLSVSFTYTLPPQLLGQMYSKFALEYNDRFIQFAQQSLSGTTQQFRPTEFWLNRTRVADAMRQQLQVDLGELGLAELQMFQVLTIDFLDAYEDTIVGIQLAVQMRTTNEYKQQVTRVMKEIDVMETQTEAAVNVISGRANAVSLLLLNNARISGFNITQGAKCSSYVNFAEVLNLADDRKTILRYLKMKSIRQHDSASLKVGMTSPFSD